MTAQYFYRNKSQSSGFSYECKICKDIARVKLRHRRGETSPKNNARNARNSKFRVKYGIDGDQFDAAVAAQDGLCPLCSERPKRLCVDFVSTGGRGEGRVRGVICQGCRFRVEALAKNPNLDTLANSTRDAMMLRIIHYLRHPPGLTT